MYYEDLGLYFNDAAPCNSENPVVRDELWDWQAGDIGYSDDKIYIRIKFNVSDLAVAEAVLEQAVDCVFPFSYSEDFFGDIDTGDREISGFADWRIHREVTDVLQFYLIDFTDLTE